MAMETEIDQIILNFREMTNISQNIASRASQLNGNDLRYEIDNFRIARSLIDEDIHLLQKQLKNTNVSQKQLDELSKHMEVHSITDSLIGNILKPESNLDNNKLTVRLKDINSLIDILLPKTWNFNIDIVVLDETNAQHFIKALLKRGQKRIIIEHDSFNVMNSNVIYSDKESCMDAILELGMPMPKRVSFFSLLFSDQVSDSHVDFCDNFQEIIKQLRVDDNTVKKFYPIWTNNIIENLPYIALSHDAWSLNNKFLNRKVIIVSPGPSLERNIRVLQKREDCIVIATAQALPALSQHGIAPNYVFIMDPQDFSVVLENVDLTEIDLICPEYISHQFISAGFNDIYLTISDKNILKFDKDFGRKSFNFSGVSSVSVGAVKLAIQLGASSIAVIGQDLSFNDKQYFGDNAWFEKDSHDKKLDYELPGYFGNTVTTNYVYYVFAKQFSDLAADFSDRASFYNCTEGGAHIDGFSHIPLIDFIDVKSRNTSKASRPKVQKPQDSVVVLKKLVENYLINIKAFIDDLIKCENLYQGGKADRSEMNKLELKIFKLCFEIDFLSGALYTVIMKFGEVCLLGYSNKLVVLNKYSCLKSMKTLSLEVYRKLEIIQSKLE